MASAFQRKSDPVCVCGRGGRRVSRSMNPWLSFQRNKQLSGRARLAEPQIHWERLLVERGVLPRMGEERHPSVGPPPPSGSPRREKNNVPVKQVERGNGDWWEAAGGERGRGGGSEGAEEPGEGDTERAVAEAARERAREEAPCGRERGKMLRQQSRRVKVALCLFSLLRTFFPSQRGDVCCLREHSPVALSRCSGKAGRGRRFRRR